MSAKFDVSDVTKKLVKVRVRVSAYTGQVNSTDGQKELAVNNNADTNAVTVGVGMFPKAIQKSIREHSVGIRRLVNKASLPFQDGGYRIMQAKNYPEMSRVIQAKIEAYRQFVYDEIILQYDVIKEMAKTRLGSLYAEDDFPSSDTIMDRYGACLFLEPITDMSDIRIDGLTENELATIKKDTISEYEENLKSAQMDLVSNIRKAVETILKKTDNESSRYKRALSNLADICDSVPELNILGNDELNDLAEKIKVSIATKDSNVLKESAVANTALKDASNEMIDALDNISF